MDTFEPYVKAGNWQIGVLERLSVIAQELTACHDSGQIGQLLGQHSHTLLAPEAFSLYLFDEGRQTLQCLHARGVQTEALSIALSHPSSLLARCQREGQAISQTEHPQALYLPLQSAQHRIGVMAFRALPAQIFGPREQMICHSLCKWGTIALANALLIEKLARAPATLPASDIKSGFLADMSHEIRNPVNAIIGMAHLALRTELNLRQQDYINQIHRAGLSLLGQLNDLLDFSKIESGSLEIESTPFSLDEVLNNIATVTSQRAAEKQLEYWFNIAPDVPGHYLGDPLRLSQVLINLVNHAIKSTDSGEVELRIQRLPATPPTQQTGPDNASTAPVRLEIAVRHSGAEITPAQLEKLFQPFGQTEGQAPRKQGGSGLGLAISRQLTQMMGSQLGVRSAAGQGTTFHFALELPPAAGMPAPLPAILAEKRILLVDDNPQALQAMASMLQGLSLQVCSAPSGIAALRAMIAADQANDPFALVLADWHMPKMNGIELRKRLAERPVMSDGTAPAMPKVVLLGSFGRDEELPDPEAAGFAAIWCKPMSQSSLLNNLCTLYADTADNVQGTPPATLPFHGASVLLAEDNDINQQIAVELLSTVGIRVDIANTGLEAVEKLLAAGEQGYNAILMDLEMPEMNGHQATLRIRSQSRFNDVPIIAMTAHAVSEVREQCLREGMQDYLSKPIQPENLFQTLARWIKRQ